MGSTCLEWAEYNPVWPYVGRVTDNCGAKSREVVLSSCGNCRVPRYGEPRFSGPMLMSVGLMFCPNCKAEYIKGVTRCSDCEIDLVENLSESGRDSDVEQSRIIAVRQWISASRITPIFAIFIIGLAAFLNFARGKKGQTFDGVLIRRLPIEEFFPGATGCPVSGTPYVLHSSPELNDSTPMGLDALEQRVQGVWRIRFRGDLSAIGRYGKYWRIVRVTTVYKVEKLESCNSIN